MSRPKSHILSARTDRGAVRPRNEDAVLADVLPVGRELGILLAVADGVGGQGHGDWASQRCVELLREYVAAALAAGSDPRSGLAAAFERVNETLFQEAESLHPGAHPATTLAAALIIGESLWWANVGDSRVYLIGPNSARQLSSDHSLVAEQVRAGVISTEEAADAPFGNVITRSIGFEPQVAADSGGPIALAPGDVVLLCSDGLYRVVRDEEFASVAALYAADSAARELISMACERGAPDNVSVVIYRVPNPLETQHDTKRLAIGEPGRRRSRWRLVAWVMLLALVALGGAAGGAAAAGWLPFEQLPFGG
ncbi:Serine/threonine phosphatase stp [bacterium HR29]|jgi:serine/threonine protein phosphatase PrpC|nr:Serine/threonine phosphatase stp [bacterium HR29]